MLTGLVALNAALVVAGLGLGGRAVVASGVRIGLVFDVGGLGDKSFNDAANAGLQRAKNELGVAIRTIEPGDGSDRASALRQLAAEGDDLVIGVGFIFTDDLKKLASEFPGTKFAGIDYSAAPGDPTPPNVAGLRFREHEGSFLVGAIAGLMSQSHVVGFVGGMQIPLIRKFEAGYIAGVAHVCPACTVLSAYAGTDPKAFADPVMGKELAASQYDHGADIVYHASGKTGAGVIQAARERHKWAIGVDSNQFHEAPCCVLTSMVKKVDVAVFKVIASVVQGRFEPGVRELGLAEDGVAFVLDDDNRALIPPEVATRARELAAEIIAGKLEVPSR
ncbi:MAG: BMP family ABC transporter substrate-binding protein [Myxococcota bacterium]